MEFLELLLVLIALILIIKKPEKKIWLLVW
ncbi:Uncharacterised protein [Campylobacter coli]|nr:Uncharacterised protein [Campylobacter coli]